MCVFVPGEPEIKDWTQALSIYAWMEVELRYFGNLSVNLCENIVLQVINWDRLKIKGTKEIFTG